MLDAIAILFAALIGTVFFLALILFSVFLAQMIISLLKGPDHDVAIC